MTSCQYCDGGGWCYDEESWFRDYYRCEYCNSEEIEKEVEKAVKKLQKLRRKNES